MGESGQYVTTNHFYSFILKMISTVALKISSHLFLFCIYFFSNVLLEWRDIHMPLADSY